jgi:hypothetical protein
MRAQAELPSLPSYAAGEVSPSPKEADELSGQGDRELERLLAIDPLMVT